MTTSTFAEAAFYGIRWASMYFLSVIVYNRPQKFICKCFLFSRLCSRLQVLFSSNLFGFYKFRRARLGSTPKSTPLNLVRSNFVGGFSPSFYQSQSATHLKKNQKNLADNSRNHTRTFHDLLA